MLEIRKIIVSNNNLHIEEADDGSRVIAHDDTVSNETLIGHFTDAYKANLELADQFFDVDWGRDILIFRPKG